MQSQGNNSVKNKFRYSLENLRGLSILFVVLSHMGSFNSLGETGNYLIFTFGDATSWFVFISGYLFNYIEQRKFDYADYLGKKIRFVILPYLILSVPAIALGITLHHHLLVGLTPFSYGFWSLLVGGAVIGPMWFIPMITIFFLLSPVFHRLGTSRAQYVLVVLCMAVSLFSARPFGDLNPVLQFIHFLGFYILGIVFSANLSHIDSFKEKHSTVPIMAIALLLFAVSFFHNMNVEESSPGFIDGFGKFNNVQFGKLCLLVFVYFAFDKFMNVRNRFFGTLAAISFGIFFIHGFLEKIFLKISQKIVFELPSSTLALELGLLLGGSIVVVFVAKRVLGKWSRYVIGC